MTIEHHSLVLGPENIVHFGAVTVDPDGATMSTDCGAPAIRPLDDGERWWIVGGRATICERCLIDLATPECTLDPTQPEGEQ